MRATPLKAGGPSPRPAFCPRVVRGFRRRRWRHILHHWRCVARSLVRCGGPRRCSPPRTRHGLARGFVIRRRSFGHRTPPVTGPLVCETARDLAVEREAVAPSSRCGVFRLACASTRSRAPSPSTKPRPRAHATRNASEFERVRGTAPDRHNLVPLAEAIAFIAHDRGHAPTPGFWSQNGTAREDFSPTGEALRR